MSFKLYNRN